MIRLIDVNSTCNESDEIAKILKSFNELNHGIVNADIHLGEPKSDQVKETTDPEYTVGQCCEKHGYTFCVIAISL